MVIVKLLYNRNPRTIFFYLKTCKVVLYKVEFLGENQYSLQVKNEQKLWGSKHIANYMISIKEVRMDSDLKITIISDIVETPIKKGKVYSKLNEAMETLEPDIYISGFYRIILNIRGN